MEYRKAKNMWDVLICLVFSPLIIILISVVGLLVMFKLGRPVFFRQERPGLHGKPFYIYKFRSMTDERNNKGELLADEERLTNFGSFIRSTSLDEIPALLNVLKGDMSLVGPRPLLMEYLSIYTPEEARRHDVLPGVTGWAQVNGRNALSWEEKFKLDTWYVDNQSFSLDLNILFLTVLKVLSRKDINADGEATMPKYKGSHE